MTTALEVSRPQPLGWLEFHHRGTAARGGQGGSHGEADVRCVRLRVAAHDRQRTSPAGSGHPDSVDQIDQQLSAQKAELDELNARVEHANGELDRLDEQLARDELRLGQLRHQASQLARFEYERRDLTLVERAASASSLGEFLTELNESRLLAARERGLVEEARTVRRQDEAARAQQAAKVAELQADRDRADQAVQHSELLRAQADDAARRDRAEALVAQARATQSAVQPPPASQSSSLSSRPRTASAPPAATSQAAPVPPPTVPRSGAVGEAPAGNHFTFGYCTWYVATRRNIPWFGNAIEWWPNARAYGVRGRSGARGGGCHGHS